MSLDDSVEIRFATSDLRKLCESGKLMTKQLGAITAKKLRNRLEDLVSASCVGELSAGRPHPLKGDREGQFALDLYGGMRLVFVADNLPTPLHQDGSVDWRLVTRILIVYIGNYHE